MSHPLNAYRQNARSGLSGRRAEAALLLQCAQDLQAAVVDATVDIDRLTPAAAQNRRVWSLIAADVTEPECPLPGELRQNIVNISVFMLEETLRALVDPRPERLEPLIRLNRTIAEGLQGAPAPAQAALVLEKAAPPTPAEPPRAAGPYARPTTSQPGVALRRA
jgi:flagellar protein FlaF